MTLPRVLAAVLALVAASAVVGVLRLDRPEGTGPAPAPTPAADRTSALRVLHAWDRQRAAAWRRGDVEGLRELYLRGSVAGRADRGALAAYADRGLRVTGMRMQVAWVRVRSRSGRRITLVVTDRLVGATAVGRRREVALPADRWSTRRVVLVRTGESWRMARVTDQPSPAASTDSTSGSENR